jgi:hypothetical protein
MLTRREFLAAGTAAAALAARPSGCFTESPRRYQTGREAVPPTSPSPVSARPSDALGGTTIPVGGNPGDLQAYLNGTLGGNGALNPDGTHKGNTYVVPAGAVYGPLTLPVALGSGWTCIRTSAALAPGHRVSPSDGRQMFTVRSDGVFGNFAVNVPDGTRGWRFIGMEATHPTTADQAGVVQAFGFRTSYERCYIHGHPQAINTTRCMRVLGGDFQIWDSWISDAHNTGADAQAIWFSIYNSDVAHYSRYHVENCELQGAGENVMLSDQSTYMPTQDATFKRNHFFKPLSWKDLDPTYAGINYVVKNSFEIKWAYRVLFEGNTLENCFGQASGKSQDGTMLLITGFGTKEGGATGTPACHGEDIMVRSNKFINSQNWATIGTLGGAEGVGAVPHQRVALLNNLAINMSSSPFTAREMLANWQSQNVWIEHNTIVPGTRGYSLYLNAIQQGSFPNFTVKRNVWSRGSYGLRWNIQDVAVAPDAVIPDRTFAENAQYGGIDPALAGFTFYANAAAAGIDPNTGVLAPTSPLKVGQPGYFGTDGKDIGVDFAALDAAQTGT